MYPDEYYDQDGHQYYEQVAMEEAYHESMLANISDSIENNEYPLDRILKALEQPLIRRGYMIFSTELSDKLLTNG